MSSEALLALAGGGALLCAGGDVLVRGSAGAALRWGLPPVVIGVLVMGFGTSLPELLTSVEAARLGAPEIALGNVLGSNTANVLLIVGVAALIMPFAAPWKVFGRDMLWVLGVSVGLAVLLALGALNAWIGVGLLAGLVLYACLALRSGAVDGEQETVHGTVLWQSLALIAAGLAGAIWGAGLFVDGAVALAQTFGVSEAVIGATVVAVGTSLPELACTLAAARRGQSQLALGNVLGSNVFNVLGVLGASALAAPLLATGEALWRDVPVMIAAAFVLAAALFFMGRVGRWAGVAMLAAYAAYIAWMF